MGEAKMRTLGLVGGTGWVSTVEYYRIINEEVGRRLGGLEAAKIVLYSLNYGDVNRLNEAGDGDGVSALVCAAAERVERAGADGLLLCANTLHLYAEAVQSRVSIPVVHIADAASRAVLARNVSRVGLLGTRATMEREFYRGRLKAAGIDALVPGEEERMFIQGAITGELLRGLFRSETKDRFLGIVEGLRRRGAEAVMLGCTEIPLLVKQEDTDLPLFDTLAIHARAAADFALGGSA